MLPRKSSDVDITPENERNLDNLRKKQTEQKKKKKKKKEEEAFSGQWFDQTNTI